QPTQLAFARTPSTNTDNTYRAAARGMPSVPAATAAADELGITAAVSASSIMSAQRMLGPSPNPAGIADWSSGSPQLTVPQSLPLRQTLSAQATNTAFGMITSPAADLEYQRLELERQRLALDQERWREERAERIRWETMYREQWQEDREERRAFREREQHIWKILLSVRGGTDVNGIVHNM
ncbi:hypothetical protein FBU59_001982, partial [Linderina macrospora]